MMEISKKIAAVAAFLIFAVMVGGIGNSEAGQKNYSFVSSNPGGTWYNMVGGAITLYNENIPGSNFSVEATGGSVENVRRVATGEADLGLAYSSHMYNAWKGEGNYKGRPAKDIRYLFQVCKSPHYFVTLKKNNITSMKDLIGKEIAIGAPGSGTSDNSRNVLGVLGIDTKTVELSFGNAARALQDGKIDALGQGGAPAAGIVELAASQDILIIPYSDEELQKIVDLAPYYEKGVLKANMYKGQDKDVPTFYYNVNMIAHKSVPDDVIYDLMKVSFSDKGREYLSTVHKQWKTIQNNPGAIDLLKVPYHPGAVKFWKEYEKN